MRDTRGGSAKGGRRSVNVTPPTTPRRTPPGAQGQSGQNYSPSSGGGVGIFGMRPIPSSALGSSQTAFEEEETDPETVAASPHRRFGAGSNAMRPMSGRAEEVHDDPTVQLSRLPIAFIGESVMDPETVYDQRPEAARWREDTHARFDEMPPAPMPSAMPDRSSTTLARQARNRISELPELTASWSIIDPRTAVLAPLLGGAVGGFVFMLILLALYAGSP